MNFNGLDLIETKEPVSSEVLDELRSRRLLPESYLAFLRVTDGATCDNGLNLVFFNSGSAVLEAVDAYSPFLPDFRCFANDGAEAMFGFLSDTNDAVFVIHADDLSPELLVELAPSLGEFLQPLSHADWMPIWNERMRLVTGG